MRLSISAGPDTCTRGWTEWTRADRPAVDRSCPRGGGVQLRAAAGRARRRWGCGRSRARGGRDRGARTCPASTIRPWTASPFAATRPAAPLRIVDESRAGRRRPATLAAGEAIRISTGAAMPAGADAVAPIEQVREADGKVTLTAAVEPGQHVRRAGEDLRAGAVVLTAGTVLDAGALSVAVGAGAGTLSCARRPRVAVLCTGDELRPPGSSAGARRDPQLERADARRARRAGGRRRRRPPRRCATRATRPRRRSRRRSPRPTSWSSRAACRSDRTTTSSRRSTALGVTQRFWRVDLQPGKPTWFGTRGAQLVFGLPGNPVSSYVTFVLFARPALRALQGADAAAAARAGDAGRDCRGAGARRRCASASTRATARCARRRPAPRART